jgi:4-hydroxy-2-oxoheptanedioate aldolase
MRAAFLGPVTTSSGGGSIKRGFYKEGGMRHNRAKEKLAAGTPISVIAPGYSSAGLVELVGRMGFDAIFIDCEHGPAGWEEVENMVRAAELADATPIVRVQANDPSTITRALDRGAGGVQVPHVNTRAEAEAAVRHAKFAPIGHRGFAGGRAAFGVQGSFTEHANAETMVVVMLEEVEALRNLDEILQVEHVDAFFIAPGDLSQSMGYPGQTDHPEVQAAIDDAVRRTRAAGRAPGVLTTPATVERYLELGALFMYVSLGHLLQPGANDFLAAFKAG